MIPHFSQQVVTYSWNTTGCYPATSSTSCFPYNQTTESVFVIGLTAKDAGTITCTATIGDNNYTSVPLTIRISGNCIQ